MKSRSQSRRVRSNDPICSKLLSEYIRESSKSKERSYHYRHADEYTSTWKPPKMHKIHSWWVMCKNPSQISRWRCQEKVQSPHPHNPHTQASLCIAVLHYINFRSLHNQWVAGQIRWFEGREPEIVVHQGQR